MSKIKADKRASQNRCHGEPLLDVHRCRACDTCNPALIGTPAPETCSGCGANLVEQRSTVGKSGFVGTFVKTDKDGKRTYRRGLRSDKRSQRKAISKINLMARDGDA